MLMPVILGWSMLLMIGLFLVKLVQHMVIEGAMGPGETMLVEVACNSIGVATHGSLVQW